MKPLPGCFWIDVAVTNFFKFFLYFSKVVTQLQKPRSFLRFSSNSLRWHTLLKPATNLKSTWDRPSRDSPNFTCLFSMNVFEFFSATYQKLAYRNSKRSSTKTVLGKQIVNNWLNSRSLRRIWFHSSSLCSVVWIHFLGWCIVLCNFSLDLNGTSN